MQNKPAKIKAAILVCSGFEESEMVKPRAALDEAGIITHLISPTTGKVTAWSHDHWSKKYNVDVKLSKAKSKDYDLLVLPGGVINPDELRTHKPAIKFIDDFLKSKKLVAAICHGPLTLIETGKMKGKKLTSYHSVKTDLKNAGARWQNKKVVVDGTLITSRQPSDIPAFNKAVLAAVSKSKTKKKR